MGALTVTESKDLETSVSIQDALIQIVQRTDIDPERLEKFLDLQIKMENRQAEKAFNDALSGFQGECPIITKKKKVKFNTTSYDYAPLDEIIHIIKPILAKHGLSYSFDIETGEAGSTMITTVYHKGGFSKKSLYAFDAMADGGQMNQSQRRKSAVSYAKRAGLENALGLVTAGEDDDARRAIDNPVTKEQLDQIFDLVAKTKSDMKGFCEFLKVTKIEDLSEYDAKKAINALKAKRSACIK